MTKSCLLSIFFLFLLTYTYGQNKQDKQLAKVLDEILSGQFKPRDPGCAVLVTKKGQIIYEKSFGSADMELNVPLKPEMIFRLGSMTKQFTAVAILQLMEQGKLSLQDSVQKFIKDFPYKGYKVTIENLLTHTSGIKDYTQLDLPDPFIRRKDFPPKQIIDLFKNEPLEFQPGTKFKYSNSGYFLLGYIIETVTNKTYSDFIQENIIKPLGLANTYYDNASQVIPNRVKGYKKEDTVYENTDYQSATIPFAAGALISNVEDLYKWHQALYNYVLIKKETIDKAFTPFKLSDGTVTNYGYGWFIIDIGGSQSIQHGGSINGFKSNEIYFPKEDVFVAALFNCECAPMEDLSSQIASLAIGKIPDEKGIEISEDVQNSYIGKYFTPLDTKRPLVISREKNKLFISVPNEWIAELIAVSHSKFKVKNIRPAGSLELFKDSQGHFTKLIWTQSGKQTEFTKSE
ncbi:MAG: beta-lactamase family protein [Sphingobacteriales bacterium]|nr:beta-lactamase family protein [Sphingobacteriales bacterium]MBI3717281.1 beta-lactamase family protein [Sphingobacteriales bacterium]